MANGQDTEFGFFKRHNRPDIPDANAQEAVLSFEGPDFFVAGGFTLSRYVGDSVGQPFALVIGKIVEFPLGAPVNRKLV